MKIAVNSNYTYNNLNTDKTQNRINSSVNADTYSFTHSKNINNLSNSNKVSFSGFFSKIVQMITAEEPYDGFEDTPENRYRADLAEDLGVYANRKIRVDQLACVLAPNQVQEFLKDLKEEQFNCTLSSDISAYCCDLDNKSVFSKGEKSITEIMSNVADYADYYAAKNPGKKFTFALTDKDNLTGLKEALCIIAQDPLRFQNLNFIPAVKMSFSHDAPTSQLKYENTNVILYGINPFSKNLSSLLSDLLQKRSDMILSFIKEVSEAYPEFMYEIAEFAEQNDVYYNADLTQSDLYWRALEYVKAKVDTVMKDGLKNLEGKEDSDRYEEARAQADELIANLMFNKHNSYSPLPSHSNFEEDKTNGYKEFMNQQMIKRVTHETENGVIITPSENLLAYIVNCFNSDGSPRPVMALETPFYMTHYYAKKDENGNYSDAKDYIGKLIAQSDGMMTAVGVSGPKYRKDDEYTQNTVSERYKLGMQAEVDKFNKYIMSEFGLSPVGGSFDIALKKREEELAV